MNTGMSQQMCKSNSFIPELALIGGDFDYIAPDSTDGVGYLVIVPQMRFDCHGYVSGWSAHTYLDSDDSAIDILNHDITFQLWRPSAEDNSIYSFIGSQKLVFIGESLRNGLTIIDNGRRFFNFTSAQPRNEDLQLHFQPGDIIGWYIHTNLQSIEQSLTIVYRNATNNESNLQPVDMYRIVIDNDRNNPPPCQVSLSSSCTARISSVIPYVTVDYGKSM